MPEQIVCTVLLHHDPKGRGIQIDCVGVTGGNGKAHFTGMYCNEIERLTGKEKCDLAVYNDHTAEALIRSVLGETFTERAVDDILMVLKANVERMEMPLGVDSPGVSKKS